MFDKIEFFLNRDALLPFLFKNLLHGLALGVLISMGLLYVDFGGLKTLIDQSPSPHIPLLMLFFGLCITFGSVSMAIAVMGLGKSSTDKEPKNEDLEKETLKDHDSPQNPL